MTINGHFKKTPSMFEFSPVSYVYERANVGVIGKCLLSDK